MTAPASERQRRDEREARGTALLAELATLPPGHPRRAAVREAVIRAWLPLARALTGRYATYPEPFDDLVQTATVGLIKSVDRYDPARGVDFPAFAVPTILGELRRHFRDRTWAVRVPRRLQEMRLAIQGAHATLTQTLGRAPTVAEVAGHLDTTEEAVLEGLEATQVYNAVSLSTPAGAEGGLELGDLLGGDEAGYELTELRLDLGPALARLSERERRILHLRFHGNCTQSQIGEQLGMSQMHVSRLISAALAKLRADFERGPA